MMFRTWGIGSLDFTGIDEYYKILEWLPKEEFSHQKTINPEVKGKLEGNMYSAVGVYRGYVDL